MFAKNYIFLLGFLFVGASFADTNISSCQYITAPGAYVLNESLIGAPLNMPNGLLTCIAINSSDVNLDCSGFNITYNETQSYASAPAAIFVTNETFTNITIRNCLIDNYRYGVFLSTNYINISNNYITIFNNTFSNSLNNGVNMYMGSFNNFSNNLFLNISTSFYSEAGGINNTFSNNLFEPQGNSNALAMSLSGVNYSTFSNNTCIGISRCISFFRSKLNTLSDNTAINLSGAAFGLDHSFNFTISNNLAHNISKGFGFTYAYNNTLINNTVSESNGNVGAGESGFLMFASGGNLFINNTNCLLYNGTSYQLFYSTDAQRNSSSGNTGWWPTKFSNGFDAVAQGSTAWYNGTAGGRTANGTFDASLMYWFGNSPYPTMLRSFVSPSMTVSSIEDRIGYCSGIDVENATLRFYYKWFLDGALNRSGVTGYAAASTLMNVDNISSSELQIGQNWTLECTANDGEHNSSALNSTLPGPGCISATQQTFVCGDTVTESCIMNTNLTLNGTCFRIGAANITLDCAGYSIIGPTTENGYTYALYNSGYSNVTLENCTISGFTYGIWQNASNGSILNNRIYPINPSFVGWPRFGMQVDSPFNLVEGNTVVNATIASSGAFGTWRNNYATGTQSGYSLMRAPNNTFINNTAVFTRFAFTYSNYTVFINNTVSFSQSGGLSITASPFSYFEGNSAYQNLYGFFVQTSSSTFVANNASDNYQHGFYFERNGDLSTENNLIANNTINGNEAYGILIEDVNRSQNNTISGNNFTHNGYAALYIMGWSENETSNDNVIGNFADSNGDGLMVAQTDGTTFANNTVLNSRGSGFTSYKAASHIYDNTFCRSGWTDMYSYNWSDHPSDGNYNTCDHFDGWNDGGENGSRGCTNLCPNVSVAVVLLFPENGSILPSNDSLNLTFIANDILNGTTLNCTLNVSNSYEVADLNLDAQSRVPRTTAVAGLQAGSYLWQGRCVNFDNQIGISVISHFILSAVCGNDICEYNETCDNCPVDCGVCPYCGDGTCSSGENCNNCPDDCGRCSGGSTPYCGDGRCNGNENCSTCAGDCGACPGPVCSPATCPNGVCVNNTCMLPYCGDGTCGAGENCSTCSSDCGQCPPIPACGDGTCSSDENCSTCSADCGNCTLPICSPATCPNGVCVNNTCVAPYCGDAACNNNESCSTCSSDCGKCVECSSDSECSASERCSSGSCVQKTGCAYSNPGCGPCFLCTNNACVQSPNVFRVEAPSEVPINSTAEATVLDQSGSPVAGLQVTILNPLGASTAYVTNSIGKFAFTPSIAGQYSYQLPCELARFTNAVATSAYNPAAPAGTRTLVIPIYVTEPSSLQLSVLSLGKPMQANLNIAKPDTSATDTATDSGGKYHGVLTVPGKYVFTITAYNAKSLAADLMLSPLPAKRGVLEDPNFWILLLILLALMVLAYLFRDRILPLVSGKKPVQTRKTDD